MAQNRKEKQVLLPTNQRRTLFLITVDMNQLSSSMTRHIRGFQIVSAKYNIMTMTFMMT